ncbi:unnamed protein product [Lota lota]
MGPRGPGPGSASSQGNEVERLMSAGGTPLKRRLTAMSIIIVALDRHEFDEMIELDGDEERISCPGTAG